MENKIIEVLSALGTDKFHTEYLMDLGDEIDVDGETYPIACDTVLLVDGSVYVCDSNDENEDGSFDDEDLHAFSDLDDNTKCEVANAINMTVALGKY